MEVDGEGDERGSEEQKDHEANPGGDAYPAAAVVFGREFGVGGFRHFFGEEAVSGRWSAKGQSAKSPLAAAPVVRSGNEELRWVGPGSGDEGWAYSLIGSFASCL